MSSETKIRKNDFDAKTNGRYLLPSVAAGTSAFGHTPWSCGGIHVTCYQAIRGEWVCPNPFNSDVVAHVKQQCTAGILLPTRLVCVQSSVFDARNMWTDDAPVTKSVTDDVVMSNKDEKSNQVTCANCGSTSTKFRCGRCKTAFYCSTDCQKSHWDNHRPCCKKPDSMNVT